MESKGRDRVVRIAVWVAVLALLLTIGSSLLTAVAASAHTALKSMTPAPGSTVRTPPTEVVLVLTEPVSASFATVTVTDGQGRSVSAGRARVSGATVTQPLREVADGRYAVAWRVVSADGHPVSGRASFAVAVARATPTTTGTTPSTTASPGDGPTTAEPTPAATSATPGRGQTPQPAVPWALAALLAAGVAGGAIALGAGRSRRR
jgi:methionine-rich copper-binding protein CopC